MIENKDSIQSKLIYQLKEIFQPIHLDVINESFMHHVPKGSETHFKIVLVSQSFINLNKIKRHQSVYQAISEWMNHPIHALALHLFTPTEWETQKTKNLDSPQCLGGSKKNN